MLFTDSYYFSFSFFSRIHDEIDSTIIIKIKQETKTTVRATTTTTKKKHHNRGTVACDGSTLPDQNESVPAPVTTTINTKLYMLRSHPGPCNGRGNLSLSFSLASSYLYTLILFSFSFFFPALIHDEIDSFKHTHTEFLPGTTRHRSIMKDEEEQPLLGNTATDITTDSKTITKKKKGSSGVRVCTAVGTFAVVLLGGVVLFTDRGKIHNAIVNNDTNMNMNINMNVIKDNKQDTCYEDPYNPNPDFKKAIQGICETTEIGSVHVLPYLNHQKIIPGKIYYGLDFTDDSMAQHYGITYSPHYFPKTGSGVHCEWGDGKSVGRCIRNGKPPDDDVRCPSKKKHIVEAWQRCAILCNDAKYCLTFTVKLHALFGHYDFNCYFHGKYVCEKNDDNQSVGIDHYVPQLDHEGVWSGICRTISGRTSDYACSKTPIPCGNCANSQPCCRDGGAFDFSCPGCGNGRI